MSSICQPTIQKNPILLDKSLDKFLDKSELSISEIISKAKLFNKSQTKIAVYSQ
jgi:hypothetical protein